MAPCAGGELTDPALRSDISLSLFSHLAERMGFAHTDIAVEKESSGRPSVAAGDERWGASITHTRGMIACAVNRSGSIGIDLERTDRSEHPALRKRMLSAGDSPDLIDRFSTIQLWTIKEAVLKLYGTGLRVPMKNVVLSKDTHGQFRDDSTDTLVAGPCKRTQRHCLFRPDQCVQDCPCLGDIIEKNHPPFWVYRIYSYRKKTDIGTIRIY
jgi:phosphopantetheinyl transferase